MSGIFGGVRIQFSAHALKDTEVPNFPPSKNRSKRVEKKLLKRLGYRKAPAIWRVGDMIVAHPSFRAQLDAALSERAP